MNRSKKQNPLPSVVFCICAVGFIALGVVSCINTPTVAFNQNGQCQWVQNEHGRDLTACQQLPDKYNRIVVANNY